MQSGNICPKRLSSEFAVFQEYWCPFAAFPTALGHRGGRIQTGDRRECASATGLAESPSCPEAQSRGPLPSASVGFLEPWLHLNPQALGGLRRYHCLAPSPGRCGSDSITSQRTAPSFSYHLPLFLPFSLAAHALHPLHLPSLQIWGLLPRSKALEGFTISCPFPLILSVPTRVNSTFNHLMFPPGPWLKLLCSSNKRLNTNTT